MGGALGLVADAFGEGAAQMAAESLASSSASERTWAAGGQAYRGVGRVSGNWAFIALSPSRIPGGIRRLGRKSMAKQ